MIEILWISEGAHPTIQAFVSYDNQRAFIAQGGSMTNFEIFRGRTLLFTGNWQSEHNNLYMCFADESRVIYSQGLSQSYTFKTGKLSYSHTFKVALPFARAER